MTHPFVFLSVTATLKSTQQRIVNFSVLLPKLLLYCGLFFILQPIKAQETSEFQNFWKKSYIQADGASASLGNQGEKAVWTVEQIPNSSDVRIKNVKSNGYLHAQTDARFPAVGAIEPGWWSAMWVIEPIAGTQLVRIRNKWLGTYLNTESGALELGNIQPGWQSAQWQRNRASSVASTSPSTTNGWVAFLNSGAYVARYTLTYTMNGQSQSFETGNVTVGMTRRFDIPASATNVKAKGEFLTGLAWAPWKTIFEQSFTSAPNKCYRSLGTTISQQWDNNCQ
jgi:hypothetical protein